jgi:hypothetical protein
MRKFMGAMIVLAGGLLVIYGLGASDMFFRRYPSCRQGRRRTIPRGAGRRRGRRAGGPDDGDDARRPSAPEDPALGRADHASGRISLKLRLPPKLRRRRRARWKNEGLAALLVAALEDPVLVALGLAQIGGLSAFRARNMHVSKFLFCSFGQKG